MIQQETLIAYASKTGGLRKSGVSAGRSGQEMAEKIT